MRRELKKMRMLVFLISVLLLMGHRSYAQEANSSDRAPGIESYAVVRTHSALLIDPGLTMRSGAESIITAHRGLAFAEDKLIGTRWFREKTVPGKIGGVAGRLAKYALIDLPVDYFSIVLAHEYFGHGARYREFNMEDIHYRFDLPPPYGGGGGEASNYREVSISMDQVLAVWQGGMEIHSIINRNISLHWMATDRVAYREASQFFFSFQIMMNYIQETNGDLADGEPDNDPRAYVRIINARAGFVDVDNLKMDVESFKSKMLLNAANPFVFYSLMAILKTYLWDGNRSFRPPMLRLGAVGYIPGLRVGLTPFGLQYHLENYFRFKKSTSIIDLGYGDRTFFDSWGGIGILVKNVYEKDRYSFDGRLDVWSQPEIQYGGIPAVSSIGGIGGAFSVIGYYTLSKARLPVSAVLELGYKSAGFIEGYDIESSPILMVGLSIRN